MPTTLRGATELPMQFRQARIESIRPVNRAEGDEPAGDDDEGPDTDLFELTLSSEFEVERWFGVEVLEHSDTAVDLSRGEGLAFLADHNRSMQAGVFEKVWLADRKLHGLLRFSRNTLGRELKRDILDRIKRWVSIGYAVKEAVLVEIRDQYEEVWRVTRWELLEASSVSIPADPSVGFGRSAATTRDARTFPLTVRSLLPGEGGTTEEATMPDENRTGSQPAGGQQGQPGAGAQAGGTAQRSAGSGGPSVSGGEPNGGAGPAERAAPAEIVRICQRFGAANRAAEYIERGLTADEVCREILFSRRVDPLYQAAEEAAVDMTEREARSYSYARAILRAMGEGQRGFEDEIHEEIRKKLPDTYKSQGGIFVPLRTRPASERSLETRRVGGRGSRALDSNTGGRGTEVVFDEPGELIELLRNQARVIEAGARTLVGLNGPVTFPKQTGALTVHWVPENPASDVDESDLGFGTASLVPKTMQGTTAFSRQLLAQAILDVESMVREDLAQGHALALDRSALHGRGVDNEPHGIYVASDVNIEAIDGVPTFGSMVNMATKVAAQNALMGNLSYMTNPLLAGVLMQTLVADAAGSRMIWEGNHLQGTVAGYTARSTNQVRADLGDGGDEVGVVFGNWGDLLIGMWGAMELVVDPYSKKKRGMIEVTSFQMADIVARHGESFTKATGAVLEEGGG